MSTITHKGMLGVAALLLGLTLTAEGAAQGHWGRGMGPGGRPGFNQGGGPGYGWGMGGPGYGWGMGGPGMGGPGMGMGRHGRGGGPGFMADGAPAVEQKLAFLKGSLSLTPQQLPAWQAYEQAVTAHAKVHDQLVQSRGAPTPNQQGLMAAREESRNAMAQSWLALQKGLSQEQAWKIVSLLGPCATPAGVTQTQ